VARIPTLTPLPAKTTIVAPLGTAITLKSTLGTDKPDRNLGPPEIEVTATKFVDPVKGVTDPLWRPRRGDRLVAVAFAFTDRSVNPYRTAVSDTAWIVDDRGRLYKDKVALNPPVRPLLTAVNVPAGGTQAGYVPFEVPQQTKITKARWTMDMDTGQVGEWTLR
jgi:hypothetical protein